MEWFYSFGAAILLLAYGNALLGANTRRSMAVKAGRKHSQTGELLEEFGPAQRILGWSVVIAGGVFFIVLSFLWAYGADLPY